MIYQKKWKFPNLPLLGFSPSGYLLSLLAAHPAFNTLYICQMFLKSESPKSSPSGDLLSLLAAHAGTPLPFNTGPARPLQPEIKIWQKSRLDNSWTKNSSYKSWCKYHIYHMYVKPQKNTKNWNSIFTPAVCNRALRTTATNSSHCKIVGAAAKSENMTRSAEIWIQCWMKRFSVLLHLAEIGNCQMHLHPMKALLAPVKPSILQTTCAWSSQRLICWFFLGPMKTFEFSYFTSRNLHLFTPNLSTWCIDIWKYVFVCK